MKLGEYYFSPREPGKWSKELEWGTIISVFIIGAVIWYLIFGDFLMDRSDEIFLSALKPNWYVKLFLTICFLVATLNWLLHFRWFPTDQEQKVIDDMHKLPLGKDEHYGERLSKISWKEQYFSGTFRQRDHLPQLGRLSVALAFLVILLLLR